MNQRLRTWLSRLSGRTQTEPPASRHDSEKEAPQSPKSRPSVNYPSQPVGHDETNQ